MSDTVTLALEGTVSLSEFAAAMGRFEALIRALAAASEATGVLWQLDGLDYGSATATARGIPSNGAQPDQIDRVVRGFVEVGQALERGTTVPFSATVKHEACSLAALLGGSAIDEMRFDTADGGAVIRKAPTPAPLATTAPARTASYGAVTGRIQTLTNRTSLRFVVYDHLHDRAVPCYLVEGREAMMRQMWDRVATVEGWVTREPGTGRPLAVRRVSGVTPLAEVEPDAYKRARGAIPRADDEPLPEALTRRWRDAG